MRPSHMTGTQLVIFHCYSIGCSRAVYLRYTVASPGISDFPVSKCTAPKVARPRCLKDSDTLSSCCGGPEYRFKAAISGLAALGLLTSPSSISWLDKSRPYRSRFASPSGRKVAPSNDKPANNPRDRDQDKISARNKTSVLAPAFLPTGPAAAAASPPMVNLSDRSLL